MNKKLIFVFFFVFIFLIGSVSAELQFDNIKQYNNETKTVEIINTFGLGSTYAEIQLISPTNVLVPLGYNEVARFEVRGWVDYEDFINQIEFFNMRKDMDQINRNFDLRILDYEEVIVNDSYVSCSDTVAINGSIIPECEQIITGNHSEIKEVWNIFDPVTINEGENITLAIYTDVQPGDKVDWVPEFMGVKVPEWASWTASLDLNLTFYYSFNEAATAGGTIYDELFTYNATNGGADNTTGIVNSAYNFDGTEYIDTNFKIQDLAADKTVNYWVRTTDAYTSTYFMGGSDGANYMYFGRLNVGNIGRIEFMGRSGGKTIVRYAENNSWRDGNWHMISFVQSGDSSENFQIYIDAIPQIMVTDYDDGDLISAGMNRDLAIGGNNNQGSYIGKIEGDIDEVGYWRRTLSVSELQQLYNNGAGLGYSQVEGSLLNVSLISPTNDSNFSYTTIPFEVNVTDNFGVQNVSLLIDGIVDQTNNSGYNGTYYFSKSLSAGIHNWSILAYDNDSNFVTSEVRTLNITVIPPTIELSIPGNGINQTASSVDFYAYVYDNYEVKNVSLYINGTINQTNTAGINATNYSFTQNFNDGYYTWYVEAYDNDSLLSTSPTRSITIHTVTPTLSISDPSGFRPGIVLGENETLIWNLSEAGQNLTNHIADCKYEYNGTNYTIDIPTCVDTQNLSFLYIDGVQSVTMYVSDIYGLITSDTVTWTYPIVEVSQNYDASVLEGLTQTIQATVSVINATVGYAALIYDGGLEVGTITEVGNNTILSIEKVTPEVETTEVKNFYWTIVLSDATEINLSEQNQSVFPLQVDDCSINNFTTLGLFLKDEESQDDLNGTIEINLEILNDPTLAVIANFSEVYENISEKYFCTSLNLNETGYLLNAEIRYDSNNHSREFYNIQRASLEDYPSNVTLYDLEDSVSVKFKITYQNENLVGVEDAVVQLLRKYIDEGVYKIVEAPLTSSDSTAIVHVDTNTNIYRANVVKDGVVLGTFENLVFVCESELTGECTLDLLDTISPDGIDTLEDLNDFSYEVTPTDTTVDMSYTIPSGTPANVNFIGRQTSIIGESVVCNLSVLSGAGSVSCPYNKSIGESVLTFELYKDGELQATKGYVITDDISGDFKGYNYFIVIILVLSLAFMAVSSPELIIVNAVVALLLAGGVWLVNGLNFVVGIGTLMWLIIAAIILIMKISKQEDQ